MWPILRNTCILHSVEKLIGEAEAAGDLVIERLRNRQGDFRARVGDVEQVDLLVIFTRRDFLSAQHPAKLAWRQELIEDDDMIILEAFCIVASDDNNF